MGRHQEHRELHLSSPEAARARFLELRPDLAELLVVGPRAKDGFDLIKWLREEIEWGRRFREAVASLPPHPPRMPEGARALAERIGPLLANALALDDLARELTRALEELAATQFPRRHSLGFKDERALLAIVASAAAQEAGKKLEPRELVLLEVATECAAPTSDAGDYLLRQGSAGARLRTLDEASGRSFPGRISPEPDAPK